MLKRQGVVAIVAILTAFVLLHLGLSPAQYPPGLLAPTMLGGIALLLMTITIVLSTRAPTLEELFGGLDRMYQVHRVVGVFAALFALLHFFLVPKELPPGADPESNSLIPSVPLGILALAVLVVSLFLALNRKISYSTWRPIHRAMGLVYVLAIGHFLTAPPALFDRFSASGLYLTIAAVIGVLAFLYSVFGMNKRTARPFTIEAVDPLERATEIVMKPANGMLDFTPGQFAFVEVQGEGWNEPHPFTISSAPDEDRLRFTVKALGDWTRKVRADLKPGGHVDVRGPYGKFDSSAAGQEQVWLAGGIGLTPFLSTLRAMKPGDDRHITFVYAARNEREAIFLDELKARSEALGNVKLVPLFSDRGEFARVDIMKQKLPKPLTSYDFFLCGPTAMVDGIISDLRKEGVPRDRIRTEAFEFR